MFKVKHEDISENTFMIYANLALRKYHCITLFLTGLAKTSTEPGGGAGRNRPEGGTGPGKKDTDEWDRMEPL
ncbi:hypothetical protein C0033_18620 [Clostridium sp. chh4-2]|nr:hypothetical protein C0033_18620 [Clostridium sp. chh4-2]